MDKLADLPILDILKLGLVGLCFLLCLLSFYLLHTEQKREGPPRKRILVSIYVFMAATFLFFLSSALMEIYKISETNSRVRNENETMKARIEDMEFKEKMYEKSYVINGTFNLDYYAGGKDIKFYTIPQTDINTYVENEGVTGFSITNFKPVIVDNEIRFPTFGFQSSSYCSQGTIDINDKTASDYVIKIDNPISFFKIPNINGGE